jgi:hypothetical protein
MRYQWPEETTFRRIVLEPTDRQCEVCGASRQICDHRHHRFFTLGGPVHLTSKLTICRAATCPEHHRTVSPMQELSLTMPWWLIGWDVFAWIGHRRFARHWSVPQLRAELLDSHRIVLSEDSIERHIRTYQRMVAARQEDPRQLAEGYRDQKDLILSIDGLQPEKGHETLYVVRELRAKRVWFAEPLLSSAASEVRRLLAEARRWAERLGLPVRLWLSDKQDAFVTGIAAEFPGTPHRYCENHFLRDLAKPVLEADSRAKVAMRRKIRGLRTVEREVLPASANTGVPPKVTEPQQVVLDYCTAVRGILNSDQGGPLNPPGLKMAQAVREVRASIQRNLEEGKRGRQRRRCGAWPDASTAACRRSRRCRRNSVRTCKSSER